ncbi:Clp protease N-terminal domain-containing protein, partial [Streptomyces sp. SR27]|uniref:Clp protease N-terminal domain-containing protein n=1 Tax=Streptomyces sp. SR27 TaxID=3076630 RepID=UPI00295B588E
ADPGVGPDVLDLAADFLAGDQKVAAVAADPGSRAAEVLRRAGVDTDALVARIAGGLEAGPDALEEAPVPGV